MTFHKYTNTISHLYECKKNIHLTDRHRHTYNPISVSLLIIRKQSIQLTAGLYHLILRQHTDMNQISGCVHSMLYPPILLQYFCTHFQHKTPRLSRKELYHLVTGLPNLMKIIIIIWSNFTSDCITEQMWKGRVTSFVPSNIQMGPSTFWIDAHVNVYVLPILVTTHTVWLQYSHHM